MKRPSALEVRPTAGFALLRSLVDYSLKRNRRCSSARIGAAGWMRGLGGLLFGASSLSGVYVSVLIKTTCVELRHDAFHTANRL